MWLTILKDMQLQYRLQAMLNFYLDRKSRFFHWKLIVTILNAPGA